jgi:hypothetical protein
MACILGQSDDRIDLIGRSAVGVLEHSSFEGREYDTKAIAGVAYGNDHPDEGPLAASAFSGGLGTVVHRRW